MNITTQLYEALKEADGVADGATMRGAQSGDHYARMQAKLDVGRKAITAYESLPAADEREGFERWAKGMCCDVVKSRLDAQRYAVAQTDDMWLAWQARAALSPAVSIDDEAHEETLVDAVAAYRTDHPQSSATDKDCLTVEPLQKMQQLEHPQPVSNSYTLPEGFALVPLTPTAEMLDAGNAEYEKALLGNRRDVSAAFGRRWRAMLTAAPKAPVAAPPADAPSDVVPASANCPGCGMLVFGATADARDADRVKFLAERVTEMNVDAGGEGPIYSVTFTNPGARPDGAWVSSEESFVACIDLALAGRMGENGANDLLRPDCRAMGAKDGQS